MSNAKARAKTLILKWFDEGFPQPERRQRLSTGIDRFFSEIANRETWSECISTLLGDGPVPHLLASGPMWRVRPCQTGIAFSSVVPGWGYGWRGALKDEYVYDMLSWLGHYARQYVHRSHVAKVLMIAWEQHGTILHPFGSETKIVRYGGLLPTTTPKAALDAAIKENERSWGAVRPLPVRSASAWIRRNTLDPAIHQSIFHFLRGQSLLQAGFELEALAAFDCAIQSLQTMDWSSASGSPLRSRTDLCSAMGFKAPTGALAEHIYFLRNNFVAHAGGWRWWDAQEYVDNEFLTKASSFTLRALRRGADLEPRMRKIDPSPANWSDWILLNFSALWGAIWFRDPY
jgi:hypothetical protein